MTWICHCVASTGCSVSIQAEIKNIYESHVFKWSRNLIRMMFTFCNILVSFVEATHNV